MKLPTTCGEVLRETEIAAAVIQPYRSRRYFTLSHSQVVFVSASLSGFIRCWSAVARSEVLFVALLSCKGLRRWSLVRKWVKWIRVKN
jgi:hypothetical protein